MKQTEDFNGIVEETATASRGRELVKPYSLYFAHYDCSLCILILFVTVHHHHGDTQKQNDHVQEPATKEQLEFAMTATVANRQSVEGYGTGN